MLSGTSERNTWPFAWSFESSRVTRGWLLHPSMRVVTPEALLLMLGAIVDNRKQKQKLN